jgi:hypothetical protein
MARPPIMINGKRLHECSIGEIIDVASHPMRRRFDDRPDSPHYTNRNLIRAFAGAGERTTSELIAKYPAGSSDWSDQFNALRVGEALGWAVQEGIVERHRFHPDRWLLGHVQPQFENICRGARKRSIRIHNAGALQAEHDKLWARELKTRERMRLKAMAELRPVILKEIALICRCAPDFDLSTEPLLARFAVGGFKSIAECRGLIEQSIDELDAVELYDLSTTLARICRRFDIDGRRTPPPPQASPEDLAELEDFLL